MKVHCICCENTSGKLKDTISFIQNHTCSPSCSLPPTIALYYFLSKWRPTPQQNVFDPAQFPGGVFTSLSMSKTKPLFPCETEALFLIGNRPAGHGNRTSSKLMHSHQLMAQQMLYWEICL